MKAPGIEQGIDWRGFQFGAPSLHLLMQNTLSLGKMNRSAKYWYSLWMPINIEGQTFVQVAK